MTYFEALVIAIVEGLTEFLPVSSTGHMILTAAALGMQKSPFLSLFIVSIQFGAILSVLFLYWRRFFQSLLLYKNIVIACIPTCILALLLKKYIDLALGNVLIVGINLLIGGLIMLFLEKFFAQKNEVSQELTPKKSFFIGLIQSISMFPGVSRSAATIYGGMFQGLNRKDAAEFSFFLALPIMFLATAKDLKDYVEESTISITSHEISLLIFGNIVAFIVAILAIKFFVNYIVKHGFRSFAFYRIAIGLIVIIIYQFFGFSLEIIS